MSDQLHLDGSFAHTPAGGSTLTARQANALAIISRLQPILSDELGAHLHAYRHAHGGGGHSADERCQWCSSEGTNVGQALARKGLATRRRGIGWTLPEYRPVPAGTDDRPGPNATGDGLDARGLPEGF